MLPSQLQYLLFCLEDQDASSCVPDYVVLLPIRPQHESEWVLMLHFVINVLLTSNGLCIYNLFPVCIPLGQVMYAYFSWVECFQAVPTPLCQRSLWTCDCSDIQEQKWCIIFLRSSHIMSEMPQMYYMGSAKEVMLWIFIALKIPLVSAKFELMNLGSNGKQL